MPTIHDLLVAAPKLEVQLLLVLIQTMLWYVLINHILMPIGALIISNLKSKKQFLHFNMEYLKDTLGVDFGEDQAKQKVSVHMGINTQHLISGLLCAPSSLALTSTLPTGIVSAMARHGALAETGFDAEYILVRIFTYTFGGEIGRKKNPPTVILVAVIHHSLSICLAIPMNIYYPDNIYYHAFICLMQLSVFVTFCCQQYGFTLNVKTSSGLIKMKIVTLTALFVIIGTRFIGYIWLLVILFMTICRDENWLVLKLTIVPIIMFSLFNVIMIRAVTIKLVKFLPMSAEKHSFEEIEPLDKSKISLESHIQSSSK